MSEDSFQLDGTVRLTETVECYRYVPQKIYEINQALNGMSDDELIKVMKYITRITAKRYTFRSLQKPISKKRLFRIMAKKDKNSNL